MPVTLEDGDLLLVQIDVNDKEKPVDLVIRGGEIVQEVATGRWPGAQESHVMLFVDLRNEDEKLNQQARGLSPGESRAHVVHSEPAGLIGCPLYANKQGHAEDLRVLRCTDRKLAACAAQVAVDLYLNTNQGQQSSYSWSQYGKMGARMVKELTSNNRVVKGFMTAWTAYDIYATLATGGLWGLAWRVPYYGLSYGTSMALEWISSDVHFTQQKSGQLTSKGEFKLFEQFHKYYDYTGRTKPVAVSEVCSSWAILCYQLAYVKLVRYFDHPARTNLGPGVIQSPMGLRDLYIESGLFQDVGIVQGAYDAEHRKFGEVDEYNRQYERLLRRKQKEFSLKGKPPFAEAPF